MLGTVVTAANLRHVTDSVTKSALTASQKSAFLEMAREHRNRPTALNGKTVGEMIVEQHAYMMAVHMAAADRAAGIRHKAIMDRLVSVTATVRPGSDQSLPLALALRNKSGRRVAGFDLGIEIYDRARRLLGTAELQLERQVPAHETLRVLYPVPYARFGGDGNVVRNDRAQRLAVVVDVKRIAYSDGSTGEPGD